MRHLTSIFGSAIAAAVLLCIALPATAATTAKPSIAVVNFSSDGLDWWWTAGVDPGAAYADLLTDQLVNLDTVTVVDRSHIDSIMQEKNLTISGDVSPATSMQLGRLIGAKYLIVGRIIQLAHTATNSGNLGGFINPVLSGANVTAQKVHLQVSARIIEVSTGRIVATLPEDQTKSTTSFSVAAFAPNVGGSYTSAQFTNSLMGQLINESAKDMASKVDPTKLAAGGGSGASINGHVLTIDGSADGVSEGMYFTAYATKSVKDPDTGQMTTVRIQKGTIQITSVDTHSAQGKVTQGTVTAGEAVSAE